MSYAGKYKLTVDQITKDPLTQISLKYWSQTDQTKALESYEPNLIEDIYTNELVNSKFSLRRIMLLEFSQYLENYLWKNYKSGKVTKAHLISIATMVNEKFRERVFAWNCFKEQNTSEFPDFFENILKLCLGKFKPDNTQVELSYQEQSVLIKFLDNCINSLEIDLIRTQVQKICGLPMWMSLSENRREAEFKKFSKLRKFWKAIEKNDAKLDESDRERVHFERTFFKCLITKFLDIIKTNYYNKTNQEEEMEVGEIPIDEINQNEDPSEARVKKDYKLHYLERFMELLIDLEALLPTRRFFNTLLDDTNLLIHCYLSDLIQTERFDSKSANKKSWELNSNDSGVKLDKYNLFKQLFKTLKFYTTFEIDDQTGEAKTDAQVNEDHYDKLKQLQKGVFKYFRDDLQSFCLTNIATIDKRDTLIKHLDSLPEERLYALAEYLHLVPGNADNQMSTYNKKLLIEIIIWHMERRMSQLDELNSMPLYPTEDIIWNENLVPNELRQQALIDTCLSLPKLNLQFLTLHDYLLRNFNLFRLESAYELRQDIEDACIRLKPYYSYEEQSVSFASWSRMAQPINNFTLIEVAKANVGEQAPSRVRADVTVSLEMLRDDVRNEWDGMRKHDIGFLVSIKPTNTPEQRYNTNDSFVSQMGRVYVRGCELEGILNEDGKLIGEDGPKNNKEKQKFDGYNRTFRVILDSNQYKIDNDKLMANEIKEDVYNTFNVFVRRRPKENNFKAVLESIRDLMNTNFIVPDWLRDLILGYGDPSAAHYKSLKEPIAVLDFNDTFLSYEHLIDSFPGYKIELKSQNNDIKPPFRITFNELLKSEQNENEKNKIIVQPYKPLSRGPYPFVQPKQNQVKFTPTQIEAIKSGMEPGLTIVVGPPGTGKTDVAVQIISNIYHNFPQQKTLIVTHSNQALNQLFEKIMCLDIDERHLLRLGHGEEMLETEKDFSRYGRVNYVLGKRLELLDEVDRMQKCFDDMVYDSAAYSCETALNFYSNVISPKWESFLFKIKQKQEDKGAQDLADSVQALFPFSKFFENAPQPLFKKQTFNEDFETARGCYRYIKKIFKQLEEFRAFELIRNGADRAQYLLVKEAKIIAMTCTHAALKRRDLVRYNFKYDNILMEESAQILEIETFIPLLLQNPDHNGDNRLKRWIMIGDHHQLPPVIKNMTFQKYSNMEQSLFTRFVKLGIPTVDLDAQGRCRPSLCDLFRWRYKNLGDLTHINEYEEYKLANTGFAYDYQLINVEDFNGQGESEPQAFFYQNLAEAEYVVAVFMYMRMIGYPGEKISILSTYNGQKHLIRDVLRRRCASNPLIGQPKKITTVDKYQGQQNDIVLLSLVKTKNIGHLRDVRRLVVAMSRARLGLYIFARVQLFKSCFELTPVFNILLKRPIKLHLVLNEMYPTQRMLNEELIDRAKIVEDMSEMAQFVFDFYQSKLKLWNQMKKREKQEERQAIKESNEERRRKLDEEEKLLRGKLNETREKLKSRLNIESDTSSSSSGEEDEEEKQDVITEMKEKKIEENEGENVEMEN